MMDTAIAAITDRSAMLDQTEGDIFAFLLPIDPASN
jgi:hypothetical protein